MLVLIKNIYLAIFGGEGEKERKREGERERGREGETERKKERNLVAFLCQ